MAIIGLAEVLVKPVTTGMQKKIGSEIDEAVSSTKVKNSGSKLGRTMTKGLQTAAKVGFAGVAAIGATALFKGFGRLQAIEQARAKLVGLGHDADTVTTIMANANTAVKGTAFGLGDAATVAANMVAAGIKPGKDLANTLTLIGDAATIAGTDMGSMGAIFSKAAASNKVQMDVINQLHDAGVPALQLIAAEMGVTAEEASAMASKGKVDFATFERAMTKGMGGAAQESGKTLSGAFANAVAAIGRVGANLMSGIYPKITGFFQGVIEWMGPVEEKAKVVGEALAVFADKAITGIQGLFDLVVKGDFTTAFREAFGMEEDHPFVGFLLAARDALIDFGDWAVRNKDWLTALTIAVGTGAVVWKLYNLAMGGYTAVAKLVTDLIKGQTVAQLALNKAWKAHPVGLIITVIVALVAAFIYLWNTNEGFRNFFIGAWNAIKNVVGAVGGFIVGIFRSIGDWVSNTLGPVFTWLYESIIKPVWDAISGAITTAGDKVGGVFSSIVDFVRNTFGTVFTWLYESIIKPVWDGIQAAISATWGFIQPIFQAIGDFVKNVLGPVFTWLYETMIKPVWDAIKWQIDFVSNVLLFIFDLIVFTVKNILAPAFVWLYENVIKPVWSNIQKFISTAWALIKVVFGFIVNVIRTVLAVAFTWLYESVIKPVWQGIQTFISTAWTVIKVIFQAVVSFIRTTLANVFTWLYDYIIKPVWDGIKWYISTVWSGIKIVFNAIRDFVRNVLAPIFTWVYEKVIKPVWGAIRDTIKNVWENGIRPVFQALGDFIGDKVVPAFQTAVDNIAKAWEGIKKAAGTPVFFVMETIYNQGIKKAFDTVSEKIGSKARLPGMDTSGIPHFAKGGVMGHGWKVVGEEGPELINTGPGYVYTANETKRMLAGQHQMPMGALNQEKNPIQAHEGIGGFWSNTWNGITGGIKSAWDTSVSWVRGGLAKAAELVMNPIKTLMSDKIGSSGFSGIYSGAMTNAIDNFIGWVRGKDEEFPAEEAGGSFGGSYDGALGRFFRPVGGRITSGFGASRGRYPHAGIDFAVPIGTAVKAAFDGVVQRAAWNAVGGRTGMGMLLGHGKGKSTYYGHLSGWNASPGQQVKAGETIARSGNTGRSTGPHLHFETWNGGKPHNPMAYLHDSGGMLMPGLSMLMNKTGKPEPVLNQRQWADISKLAARGTYEAPQSPNPSIDGARLVLEIGSEKVFAKVVNKGVYDATRGQVSIFNK